MAAGCLDGAADRILQQQQHAMLSKPSVQHHQKEAKQKTRSARLSDNDPSNQRAQKGPGFHPALSRPRQPEKLFDDLNHPVCSRIHEHRPVVHHRVAIVANAVFSRHLVVCHAAGRQHGSDSDLLLVAIRRPALKNRILAKARPLILREAADDCTADAAYDGSNRSSNNGTADSAGCRPSGRTRLSLNSYGESKRLSAATAAMLRIVIENLSERGGLIGLVELAGAAAALRAHGQGGYFVSASGVSAPPYGRQEAQRDSGRATHM